METTIYIFFTQTSSPVVKLQTFVFQCSYKANDCGLNVFGIVSDQGPNFLQLSKFLKINGEKPYFEHYENKIYYIFDASHLIKSVHDNLRKRSFNFEGKIAKWTYLE